MVRPGGVAGTDSISGPIGNWLLECDSSRIIASSSQILIVLGGLDGWLDYGLLGESSKTC
jgi:hypothetical protein